VGNLVDNAVRHNEGGGWVEVRTGRRHGAAFVAVSNTGPVVAEESVPSLFEPFRRVEERTGAGSGFGLGLAIVRSIAAVHGATIEAHSRTGGGLSVSVAFSEDPSPDTDAGPPADLKPA
jgi:signal transduction histidine kinase